MEPENKDEKQQGDVLDAFDAELDEQAEAIEGDIETETERKEQEKAEDVAARQGAAMAVGFVEMGLKMWKPYIEIPEEQKAALIEKGAPVAKKYDATLPPWLAPYKEEIELLSVVAVAGISIAMQIKAHEAKEAEEAEKTVTDAGQKPGRGMVHAVQSEESEFSTG